MGLHVTGLNHRRAPIAMRERLAFRREEVPAALEALRARGAAESVVLSTCNRVEVYTVGDVDVASFLRESRGVDPGDLLYRLEGDEAVSHLFRVAAGLDAMVFGETQIIGQVKEAYEQALEEGTTGRTLNRVFQRALHAAKRLHTETSIGEGGVSVPSVAAKLAEKIFEDLARRSLLVVGAGETAELTVSAFRHRGVKRVLVANRSPERAADLVRRFGGEAVPLDALAATLPEADILVACADVEKPLVRVEDAEAAVRARHGDPILAIDLGVPRNIDPRADQNDNIYLFDIDDLEGLVGRNVIRRQAEMEKCETILAEEVREAANARGEGEYRALAERVARIAEKYARPEDLDRLVKRAVHVVLQGAGGDATDDELVKAVRTILES